MQELYVKKISTRVNSSILKDFYEKSEFLHKNHKQNCFYDNSSAFKYIIKSFVNEFEEYPIEYWKNEIEEYNSRLKKDIQISVWLGEHYYRKLINYSHQIGYSRVEVLRSLMLKLIEETEVG